MRIFIGWDSRETMAGRVLEWSIRRHATVPVTFVRLSLGLVRELGVRLRDRPGSTEFTYSRFLVPHLCGYEGRALFLDCDMLCFADVRELDELPMDGCALKVVQHDYRPAETTKMDGQAQVLYPRKNWSSCMLMDCSKLRCWSPEAVANWHGGWLHRFYDVPDAAIGRLDPNWNELERHKPETKILHYTQWNPWMNPGRHPDESLWLDARREMLREAVDGR